MPSFKKVYRILICEKDKVIEPSAPIEPLPYKPCEPLKPLEPYKSEHKPVSVEFEDLDYALDYEVFIDGMLVGTVKI